MNIYIIILLVVIVLKFRLLFALAMLLPIRLFIDRKIRAYQRAKVVEKSSTQQHAIKETVSSNRQNKRSPLSILYVYIDGYIRYFIIKLGYVPSMRIRLFIYRHILRVKIARNAIVYYGAELRAPENIVIGEGTIIGDQAILDGRHSIEIGKNVSLTNGVWIWTAQHDYNSPTHGAGDKCGKVTLGDRVWIGPRSVILPGVNIGEGAVVAAGSVVTKDVEPFTLVGGVPAKRIAERNRNLIYEFKGEHIPFY